MLEEGGENYGRDQGRGCGQVEGCVVMVGRRQPRFGIKTCERGREKGSWIGAERVC
jgi:hypothetical protein